MSNWYSDTFGQYLKEIEVELLRTCQERAYVAPLYWQMVEHHFRWDLNSPQSPSFDLNAINGKRARPLMTLLVAEAIAGAYAQAMPGAVAVELLHNFTLIHDDVMDVSETRRGRITVWRRWNSSQAVNAGDGLYTWAMRALTFVPEPKIARAMRCLLEACMSTVEGQILDIGFETRMEVSTAEYVTMIYNKSGALIEGSARLGAILTCEDSATVDAYGEFAKNLGIAFQIQDDYLGIWGDESITGKSASSDIENKKKSYPLLIILDEGSESDKATLSKIYQQEKVSKEDVKTILDILKAVHAEERTRQLTNDFYDKAIAALAAVPTGSKQHDKLLGLAQFLVKRDY